MFPYYAGFSFEWACAQIRTSAPFAGCTVFDPWNGSGTTTLAARCAGYRAIGVDRNPIANVLARLRGQISRVQPEVSAPPRSQTAAPIGNDPLMAWFDEPSAQRLRQWSEYARHHSPDVSPLLLASIFRVVRSCTRKFEGSNPTWVKKAKDPNSLVNISVDEIDSRLIDEQHAIRARLESFPIPDKPVTILTASADRLPLRDDSVNLILTSPPYFTRIDYAVAYMRELAVLNFDVRSLRDLRSKLMGTTLIRAEPEALPRFCSLSKELISAISSHNSKDSAGYYKKQAEQYLGDLVRTLDEVSRVSSKGAVMHLVVQDSYYKDIPVNLAEIYSEEAHERGWSLVASQKFDVVRSLTTMNTPARAYQKSKVDETVLTLRMDK